MPKTAKDVSSILETKVDQIASDMGASFFYRWLIFNRKTEPRKECYREELLGLDSDFV